MHRPQPWTQALWVFLTMALIGAPLTIWHLLMSASLTQGSFFETLASGLLGGVGCVVSVQSARVLWEPAPRAYRIALGGALLCFGMMLFYALTFRSYWTLAAVSAPAYAALLLWRGQRERRERLEDSGLA